MADPPGKASASTSTAVAGGAGTGTKRDFFGRVISSHAASGDEDDYGNTIIAGGMTKTKSRIANTAAAREEEEKRKREARVWVSYHEGFSNAVRKPVTLREIMRGL